MSFGYLTNRRKASVFATLRKVESVVYGFRWTYKGQIMLWGVKEEIHLLSEAAQLW